MRYDKRVTIVGAAKETFNPNTGNTDAQPTTNVTLPCNITKMPMVRQKELFGTLDNDILVIRLQRPYNDFIREVIVNDNKLEVININDYYTETTIYARGKVMRGGINRG